MRPRQTGGAILLANSVTSAATASGTAVTGLLDFDSLIITLNITSAERDTGNETYDFYITTSDGVSSWDIVHFPQIATTGAKTYTAIVSGLLVPQTMTTAGPGVAANMSATMKTDTAAQNEGIKTLTAGMVRHGAWGDRISYELVIAGTVATGIVYSILITPK